MPIPNSINMRHAFTLIIICFACLFCGEQMSAAKRKTVFVNSKMHIIPVADQNGMYAYLTYLEDHIQAKVYNSQGMLLFNLNVKEITPDTCIYDGVQEEYFFNELRDVYRYENNQVVEHTFYRNGEKIFHQPLLVGDTIWYFQNHIVLPQEAVSYGVVKKIDSQTKMVAVSRYSCQNNDLLEEGNFNLIEYNNSVRQGKQFYYSNGKKCRLSIYSPKGQLLEDYAIDTLGKVQRQVSFPVIPNYSTAQKAPSWKEIKFFYPDGKLKAKKVRVDDRIEEQYFLPNGELTDAMDLDEDSNMDEFYGIIPDMPQFPGGAQALYTFLKENMKYPVLAQQMKLVGVVRVSFTVEEDGSVSNIIVVEPVHKLLNDEAVRVVKMMPKWIPGNRNGTPVKVRYTMPINFRLQ